MITLSGWITLVVLAASIVVFVGGWLAPEIVAVSAAGLLIATGVLEPSQALAGFGSPALITLLGMFVLSQGLLHSGALDRLRELLSSPRIRGQQQLVVLLGAVVAPLSAVIPNTPIVAILLPVIEGWCRRRGVSPSRVLIPLSVATITGGTLTLIGTSTSLLASDVSAGLGYGGFQLFSFTAIGIPVWLIGSLYLLLASRWLPDRGLNASGTLTELTRQGYLTEVVLPRRSPLTGTTLHASRLQRRFDVDVLSVHRRGQRLQPPLAELRLKAGDRLLLRCTRGELLRLQQDEMVALAGTLLEADEEPATNGTPAAEPTPIRLTEVLLPTGSMLAGSSLRELRFRQRFNATVLAVKRANTTLHDRLGRLPLKAGDLLLLQAPLDAIRGLQENSELVVLDELESDLPTTHRKWLAVLTMALVLLVSGLNLIPLVAAVLLGVGVLVVGGCLDASSALRSIRWDVFLLLGGLFSFSAALQQSGLAQLAADGLQGWLQGWPVYLALVAVYAVTMVGTELLSNGATVVLLLPVVAKLAEGLGQPPLLFIYAVVFAASQSFLSPIGYQTNLMVFSPGNYRFLDFLRFGWPLTATYALVIPAVILHVMGGG
ncbi:SLC13 family permease [Cyanobium sp. ATX 6A2]|uniref:SLC13 family permease n=1 Tax=Cyanobium sp. ATX 6A2 TaxID=2823700 RepID=UPI0020CCB1DF|nr:SLC13 family permease [Cyanobium sp. ATX 6A2]MCP9888670.1 SLC13 family permease [Cyanobium sp. ATX 6A2]